MMAAALLSLSGCGEKESPVVAPPALSVAITHADTLITGYRDHRGLQCAHQVHFGAEGAGEGRWTAVVLTTTEPGTPDVIQRWDTPEGIRQVFGTPEIKAPYGFLRVFTVLGTGALTTHMRFVYEDGAGESRALTHTGRCADPAA